VTDLGLCADCHAHPKWRRLYTSRYTPERLARIMELRRRAEAKRPLFD
jgi:hypothetical protein